MSAQRKKMFCPWVLMAIAFMPLYEDSRLVTAIKKSAAGCEEVVTRDGHQPLLAHTWSQKQRQRQGQQPLLQLGLQTWSQKQRQKIKREGQRHHMTEKSNWSQLQVIFQSMDRKVVRHTCSVVFFRLMLWLSMENWKGKIWEKTNLEVQCWNLYFDVKMIV